MKLKTYMTLTILVAVVVIAAALVAFPIHDVTAVVVLGVLLFLAETMAFQLPLSGSVSLGFAMGFAAMLYDGPAAACVVALLGSISFQDIKTRRPLQAQLFNSAQLALSVLGSATAYTLLGGRPFAWTPSLEVLGASDLAAAAAAAIVFFIANILLVGTATALQSNMRLLSVLKEQSFAAYLVSLMMVALLGLVLAQLMHVAGWAAVLLLVAPFAIARQTFRVYLELSAAYADTVRSLVRAIEAKDPYTRGHSERVAKFARILAERMGANKSNADAIEIAALLHDVGKIGISEATLSKVGRLTEDEVAAIREHPSKSMVVLSEVEFLAEMVPIVHAHHERIDGTGYPRGLRGDEIPYEARLLAVADTYDAMTSDRPYRAALSDDEAISELQSAAGTQLDSHVVAAMLEYLRGLPDVSQAVGSNQDGD